MAKKVAGVVLRPNQLAFAVASAFLSANVAAQTAPGTLPTGGQVTSGSATLTYSPNKLQIDQSTNKAILQWDGFSIGSSAWVNFSQPSASAVALNRVTGTNPSEIFGRLTANGQVFLSNPNGVLFAPGASVDVGGLFATTLSIADRDFLAGRYNFYNAGGAGSVVNQGVITATGYAALAGPQVKNDGIIIARAGTVALAAGDRVSLDMVGDGLIKVSVDEAALNASAINSGRIEADGGNVILTARSANALLDTVINNTGIIRANSLVERNGEIVLDGGSAGVVANSGTLEAAGVTAGTTGGTIKILGDRVGVGGVVDASGDAGGGSITIGSASSTATVIAAGTTIRADATGEGSGGFVETSGRYLEVNSAPQIGAGGTWLIDPYNIEIVDGSATTNNTGPTTFTPNGDNSQIGATLINNQLNAGTSVTIDTGGAGSPGTQAGDLLVNGEIAKSVLNGSTLTLSAFNELQINRNISMANGQLAFNAGRVTNNATVTNNTAISSGLGSNTIFSSDAFSLAGGAIKGGTGAVILRPRTASNSFGIESAATTTLTNADIASISTSDFVVFGSGTASFFSGNMTIGANAQVNGGGKNLAFFRGAVPGTTTVGAGGVSTSGNVIVSAGGGSLNGTGLIAGNQVQLRASTGIGSAAARANVAANVLAVNNSGGAGAFVNAVGPVTVNNVNLTVGGIGNNIANVVGGGGAYDLIAGSVTVAAPVNAGTINVNSAGDLQIVAAPGRLASLASTAGQTLTANSVQLLSNGGSAAITNSTGNTVLNADAFSLTGGTVNGGSGAVVLRPRTGTNSFGIEAGGQTTVTNADLAAITTSDYVVFGSGLGTTFTGDMTIGANAQVNGGGKNLAFFRSSAVPGGTTTLGPFGLATTGNVIVSGGGGVLNGNGAVTGNQVQLRSNSGIGSATSRVNTSAQTLAIFTGGASAFVNATGPVALADINVMVGGNVNNFSNNVGGGAYDLTAANAVTVSGPVTGGTVTINAGGPLKVQGSLAATSGQTLTASSVELNGGGTINNSFGNTILNADAFSLAGGAVNGGSGAVVLRPRTGTNSFGIESAGQTTVTNADIASITTSDFVVFGSGLGTTFTGNMTIGANAQVDGGGKNLAFFRSTVPGGSTTVGPFGVATTGNLIVSAGGGALNSNGGVIAGNQVQLRATTGIGSATSRINTAANVLAINDFGGSAFVNATGPVTLNNVNLTVGGNINNFSNNASGAYDLTAANVVTVTGQVTGGTMNIDAAGPLKVLSVGGVAASLQANAGQTIKASSLDVTADGISALIVNLSGNQSVNVAGDITLQNSTTNVFNSVAAIVGPSQTISAGGDVKLQANFATGTTHGVRIGGLSGTTASATNLDLSTGGDVTLSGGAGTDNGVGIGSSITNSLPNNISITAGGNVVLNSGVDGGARIGYAKNQTGGGDISIKAASLQLNGTAQPTSIRTTDKVTLDVGSVSQASNGFIAANKLLLKVGGAASLTGPNTIGTVTAPLQSGVNGVGGNFTLINSGPLTITDLTAGGRVSITNTGATTVNGSLSSGQAMDITVTGAGLYVAGAPGTPALVQSVGGQTINAASLELQSNGAGATITNNGGGNTFLSADAFSLVGGAVNGGTGAVILRPRTGTNSFGIESAGTTTVSNADIAAITTSDFVVFGSGLGTTFTGNMTIGANAQVDGGGKNLAFFRSGSVFGGSTTVGAFGVATTGNLILSGGAGALNSNGGVVAGNQVQLRATTGIGSQTSRINTAANVLAINDIGGSAFVNATGPVALDNVNLTVGGITNNFQNNVTGAYDLTAANAVTVTGQVVGGTMNVNAAGPLKVLSTGSAPASLQASAGQTISAGSLEVTAEGVNAAIINITGNQSISVAGDITLQNSTTNFANSFAGIVGPTQTISAGGDVKLQANFATGTGNGVRIGGLAGGAPTSTNLTLGAGGNVTLSGGTGTDNGVGIGSSVTNSLANDITVVAGGNVVLTSGVDGGARIGYARGQTGSGDISITAAGIQLNGAAQPTSIRTTGNVTLNAGGSIGEGPKGLIIAGALTTNSGGSTSLGGPNQVSFFNGTSGGDQLFLSNTGALDVTGVSAWGTASLANAGNITISGPWSSGGATSIIATGGGSISEQGAGAIHSGLLATSSDGETSLGGANQVSWFSASAGGDVLLANASPILSLGAMSLPGALTVNQTGALSLTTAISALSQSYAATGDISVGDASASTSTVLTASGAMTMSSGGRILLRGSDTSAGVSAIVSGGTVNMSSAGDLQLTGGAAAGSQALILGGSTIDLHVGGVLDLEGTSDNGSWARVQTATTSGTINVYFPTASSGGYLVDGFQRLKHGEDGFFTGDKPAKAGTSLFLYYGQ